MSNEPIVMRSTSTGFVTKVLPEFIPIYLEAGWVIVNEEAHGGVGDKMSGHNERVTATRQAVADAMVEYGPDGHIDGYEEITDAALGASDAIMFSGEAVERVLMALAASDGWKPEDLSKMTFGGDKTLREDYEKLAGAALAALKGDDS